MRENLYNNQKHIAYHQHIVTTDLSSVPVDIIDKELITLYLGVFNEQRLRSFRDILRDDDITIFLTYMAEKMMDQGKTAFLTSTRDTTTEYLFKTKDVVVVK